MANAKRASPEAQAYEHFEVDADGCEYGYCRESFEEYLVKCTVEMFPEIFPTLGESETEQCKNNLTSQDLPILKLSDGSESEELAELSS